MNNSKIISMITLMFLTAFSVKAQTVFSNTWTFKGQQSVSGNLYFNGSPKQVTIKQDSDRLTINFITSNGDADSTYTDTLGIPAFERFTGRSHKKEVSTLAWQLGKIGFTEVTTIYSKVDPSKADYRNTDIWTLENGELILDRKGENFTNGETWESKATYDKN
jgi:hypothetical protein